MAIKMPPCPPLGPTGFSSPEWQRWFDLLQKKLQEAYSSGNTPPDEAAAGASTAAMGAVAQALSKLAVAVAAAPDSTAAVGQLRKLAALLNTAVNFTSVVTAGDVTVGAKFGCNGKAAQAAVVLPANAVDLPTVITLANAIKAALIADGIGA